MKILVTGGTSTLIGRPTTQMKIQGFSVPLVKCLRELGHSVDQRAVTPGEDLSKYDATLVGLAPVYSVGARWVFGSLYAMGLIARGTIPGGLLVNDWDVRTPFKEAIFTRRLHWHQDNFLAKPLLPRFDRSEMFTHIDVLWDAIEHMAGPNNWPGVLVPAFDWPDVDHGLVFAETTAIFGDERYVDPSAWFETNSSSSDEPRERAWISASLHPADEWRAAMRLQWPVKEYGVKSMNQERVTEQEIVDMYSRHWGLLSHPYYQSGSGFWRNRFNYGTANGCIVLAAPYEMAVRKFGENPFCPDPHWLESLSDAELEGAAYSQWAWLDSHMWSAEKMGAEVESFLRGLQRAPVVELPTELEVAGA